MNKILVIGGGSWGTALSVLLAKNGNTTRIWEYNTEYRESLRNDRENKLFLPGIKFPENLEVIDDINKYANESEIIVLATPTQFLRNVLKNLIKLDKGKIFVNVAKGLEINTLKRISEILDEEIKEKEYYYVNLSGPTHAEEVSKEVPSAILAASKNEEIAKKIQAVFTTKNLRVYTGNDVIGSELAGALKNCIAIVAGISDGLGYGDNTKAALMTRGLNEMILIGKFFGANEKTFIGLSGFGDLVVTCTSKHSRNRYVGEELGKGKTLEEVISSMKMVSEGSTTIKALKNIIDKNNLRAPIFSALYNVLYENQPTNKLTEILMNRDLRSEF